MATPTQVYRAEYTTLSSGGLVDEECARPDLEPAHRREVVYQCPGLEGKSIRPHTFPVSVFAEAEAVPTAWDCPKHGAESRPVKEPATFKPAATKEQQNQAKAKTRWDMLIENHPDESRGDAILEDIMRGLRRGTYCGVTEWLTDHQRRRGVDPFPSFRP
jgi:hypothetical protein